MVLRIWHLATGAAALSAIGVSAFLLSTASHAASTERQPRRPVPHDAATSHPTDSSAAPSSSYTGSTSCQVYAVGNAATIIVNTTSADPEPTCRDLVQNLSGGGDYWREGYFPVETAEYVLQQVCDMSSPDAGTELKVYDSGTAVIGKDICGTLASNGWTESATSSASEAAANVRSAIPAIEAYNADHPRRGYSGMTIKALGYYDTSLIADALTIVSASKTTYCVQSTVGSDTYYYKAAGADIEPGAC